MSFIDTPFWQRDPVQCERRAKPRCEVCGKPGHMAPIEPDMARWITDRQFGLQPGELISPRRHDRLVRARAFTVWALRTLGRPLSYPQIGRVLGGRDHTTIIHLHEKAILLRLCDAEFRAATDQLAGRFYTTRNHANGR